MVVPLRVRDVPTKPTHVGYSLDTRTGGRPQKTSKINKVIVDVREFRSALPFLLYRHDIEISPVTLEVSSMNS